jgi:hypothetical protein
LRQWQFNIVKAFCFTLIYKLTACTVCLGIYQISAITDSHDISLFFLVWLGLQNTKSKGKIVIGVSFPGGTKKTMSVGMVSLLTF